MGGSCLGKRCSSGSPSVGFTRLTTLTSRDSRHEFLLLAVQARIFDLRFAQDR